MTSKGPPAQARVVIIGGGVIGCSIAYHLTRLGWRDVVLLERAQLTSGTTWHAAGLLTSLRDTETQTRLAKYSQDLYRRLEAETGQATGLIDCGSIQLAMTEDKAEEMRRGMHMAHSFGVEAHEIAPADVRGHWPLARVDDLTAAFYFPNDARVNPTDVTQALAKGARMGGAQIFERTPVTGILRERGRAVGVRTADGEVRAEYVVNCAGMWARAVGRMAGVNVPLQAAEHYYLISEPVTGVHSLLPILRDPGNCAYIREEAGKIMLGLFEAEARPWGVDGIPDGFTFGDDPARLGPHVALHREGNAASAMPAGDGHQVAFLRARVFHGRSQLSHGGGSEPRAVFRGRGIQLAGHPLRRRRGHGDGPLDCGRTSAHGCVERELAAHPRLAGQRPLSQRSCRRDPGNRLSGPLAVPPGGTARGVKKSALHDRLAAAGACFGESAGWERPNWYARDGQCAAYVYGWGRQNWFSNNAEEHAAVRERVGFFEQSSFAKLMVMGRDAARVLNRLRPPMSMSPWGAVCIRNS